MSIEQAGRLKMAREAAGYASKADAIRTFRWKDQTYYAHENGNRPLTEASAKRYAKAFRVSAPWLLFGEGSPNAHPEHSLKFDRELVRTAIDGLLSALVPGIDPSEAEAFVGAALTLLELHQRRKGRDSDPSKLRSLIADAAAATLPTARE